MSTKPQEPERDPVPASAKEVEVTYPKAQELVVDKESAEYKKWVEYAQMALHYGMTISTAERAKSQQMFESMSGTNMELAQVPCMNSGWTCSADFSAPSLEDCHRPAQ